jgi:hypothetical protein
MASQATAAGVQARCPLCGQPIASSDSGPQALSGPGAHLVSMYRYGTAEGFLLCGQCGLLAAFPQDMSLN